MQPNGLDILVDILKILVIGFVLAMLAWNLWVSYVNTLYLKSVKWVMLEVKPPKDVFKSPLAMELVLNALYQVGGTGNWFDKYWKGQLRSYFSLELASLEGKIHFFIRTPEKFRKLVESQIYAQYPQAEVSEVADYTDTFPEYTKNAYGVWGCTFKLKKDDAYPIKTYVDYGLDRTVGALKEEERIDPITPTLEYMGSMGLGEYVWMQILVRADTARFMVTDEKTGEKKKGTWKDQAKELLKKLRQDLRPVPKEGEPAGFPMTTKGQLAVIEAVERSVQKIGFDCGIRVAYLAKQGHFDANRISGLIGMLRQYDNGDLNGFSIQDKTAFDLPWQDITGGKANRLRKEFMQAYKGRGYFYGGVDFGNPAKYFTTPEKSGGKPFILNTEELATLYHLPGRVAETPTFTRIEATKAEPPSNLPI